MSSWKHWRHPCHWPVSTEPLDPSTWCRLPRELVLLIVESSSWLVPTATLHSWCLVDRAWYRRSIKPLYSCIALSPHDNDQMALGALSASAKPSLATSCSPARSKRSTLPSAERRKDRKSGSIPCCTDALPQSHLLAQLATLSRSRRYLPACCNRPVRWPSCDGTMRICAHSKSWSNRSSSRFTFVATPMLVVSNART